MIIVLTQDYFLLNAIKNLSHNETVVQLNNNSNVKLPRNECVKIIIDNFHNNVMHTPLVKRLLFIFPDKITVLSCFNIKLFFNGVKINYISRKTPLRDFKYILKGFSITEHGLIKISGKQHFILTQIASGRSCNNIACDMKTSVKTIRSHINNLKKTMKLNRICRITESPEYNYLILKE